ncbi:hypothetical protein [Nocardia africana]|nr:hypothetical protein [Nocardia africana]
MQGGHLDGPEVVHESRIGQDLVDDHAAQRLFLGQELAGQPAQQPLPGK